MMKVGVYIILVETQKVLWFKKFTGITKQKKRPRRLRKYEMLKKVRSVVCYTNSTGLGNTTW